MTTKTITRADLSEAVYQKVGLSRTESSALVEMVLDEMCEHFGEIVVINQIEQQQTTASERGAESNEGETRP